MPPRPPGARSARALLLAFAAVSVAFVVSTTVAEYVDVEIQRGASEITKTSAPAIAELTTLRGAVHRYVLLADDAADLGVDGLPQPRDPALDSAKAAMKRTWAAYEALRVPPVTPGREVGSIRQELDAAIAELDAEMAARQWGAARHTLAADVRPLADRLDEDLMILVQQQADRGSAIAQRIERLGYHSITLAIGLDTVSVLLALATALMMVRVVRRYSTLVEQRADELELFAGRVAHDILSPLGAAGLALDVAARDAAPGSAIARMAVRGQAGLRRARLIADAMLSFARAGAHPEAGARADVVEVVRSIADEVEADARARGVMVQLELASPGAVACSPGMFGSLVSNLVRNAVKYVGAGPDRRVVVRARRGGNWVRLEVEDNGPGLPEGLGARSFEPFVRGAGSREPGIGLGLATVKKVAEAHGGKVEVRSVPGRGARFIVDLPAAEGSGPIGPFPSSGERPRMGTNVH
jgi:signal transduction histidine kinase